MLLMFGIFITSCDALTCYLCSSELSTDCADPFKSSSSTCSAEHACVTAEADVEGQQFATLITIMTIIGVDLVGSGPHRNLVVTCEVFCGSDPHENFNEINLIPHQEQLCKIIKCFY